MTELKPCPFCGGEASVLELNGFSMSRYFVSCDTCSASGDHRETEEAAIEAWNRRVTDDR